MCSYKWAIAYLVISLQTVWSIEQGRVSMKPPIRLARSLIFPPTTPTRLQFICGIGIPVEDLHYESITSGYVFKAEYFLPTNATELHKDYLRPQTIHRRRRLIAAGLEQRTGDGSNAVEVSNNSESDKNDLSKYRWTVYKAMEQLGDSLGLVGRACVLRSICEVARVPFHHAGGILGEIAHIIMTPSSSKDAIRHHSDNEYFHAEILGRSGALCSEKFAECQRSLLDQITTVFDFSRHIFDD